MTEVMVRRGSLAWSKWNVARTMIDATLDRVGLRVGPDGWRETGDGLRFSGSRSMCSAIAAALEGLGLAVEIREAETA